MPNKEIDLEYNLESLVPAVSLEEIRRFEKNLSDYYVQKIKLPDELIQQYLHFHGGIPGKQCFQTPNDEIRMICRFCNIFVDRRDKRLATSQTPSWRPGGEKDVRLDYSINFLTDRFDYTDRLYDSGILFVPIAVIDTAGHNAREMSEMDLLCLDYQKPGEPSVVTWNFEMSWHDPEEIVKVADSFGEFLPMLYTRPDDFPITNENEYF